jgi:hypothetical protein
MTAITDWIIAVSTAVPAVAALFAGGRTLLARRRRKLAIVEGVQFTWDAKMAIDRDL